MDQANFADAPTFIAADSAVSEEGKSQLNDDRSSDGSSERSSKRSKLDTESKINESSPTASSSLAATRSRRSNFGNRMAMHVARERETIDVDDDDERGDVELTNDDDSDAADGESHRARKALRGSNGAGSAKKRGGGGDLQQLLHIEYSDEEDDDDYVAGGGGGDSGSNTADDDEDDDDDKDSDDASDDEAESSSDSELPQQTDADGHESRNSIQIIGEKTNSQPKNTSSAKKQFVLKSAFVDADDVIRKTKQLAEKLFDNRHNTNFGDTCAVCFHDYRDEDNELVACDRCGLTVHETCYGISDPTASPRASPETMAATVLPVQKALVDSALQTDSSEKNENAADDDDATSVHSSYSTVPWFCDPCLAGVDSLQCVACAATDGAFKETNTS